MKIKSLFLLLPIFFIVACSPSENIEDVQSAQEPISTDNLTTEVTTSAPTRESIPMSDSNENGRYFLKSHTTEDEIENVEYIRKGNENDAYGKMQIKCSNNEMRKNSADNPEALVAMDLGDWYTPTPDWTDKDIFNFICNH